MFAEIRKCLFSRAKLIHVALNEHKASLVCYPLAPSSSTGFGNNYLCSARGFRLNVSSWLMPEAKEKMMIETSMQEHIEDVLEHMPSDWLTLTTHRLDIYNEKLAKVQFLDRLAALVASNQVNKASLKELPTAFDYIRLGHPLSCILEWSLAQMFGLASENLITFSSRTMPLLAVLRKNLFERKNTRIVYAGNLPVCFDFETLRTVYNYNFELLQVDKLDQLPAFEGSTIFIAQDAELALPVLSENIDFYLGLHAPLGSILWVNGKKNEAYVSEIQHVRRRESIAMTPQNCLIALKQLVQKTADSNQIKDSAQNQAIVLEQVREITGAETTALFGSSGLSVQYAIMMGLVDHALEHHPEKAIKIIVPPNCYGGTNDQARRVAACHPLIEVLDLPVDGDHDMVQSTELVLERVAQEDAVPFIIAEIPTNPRVEVPNLIALKAALSKVRKTTTGSLAVSPVFILDQTFCPNVKFLEQEGHFAEVNTISYVSGSKFPSGGRCTAGYCVANDKAAGLMPKIEKHLLLCDNQATDLQIDILAQQLPSMLQRIHDAYLNTRTFVQFIEQVLPKAKINFVSEELAAEGFTPSVFSLDLPTKGATDEERELYKRALNLKLIQLMLDEIPNESKYCVSYGQLKGCYWTIPATSTQGTTKEGDKDYIARVSLSPDMDLEHHKEVFLKFVEGI